MTLPLLVLVGPTASGKTHLGVATAHLLGSEIISADSRQVYRGLNLGAGKDLAEYQAVTPPVRHHMIDVADPRDIYSVFHFQRDCYRVLEQRVPDKNLPPLVMVGGSGLLVEAVLSGYRIPDVPEDVALRRELMTRPQEELDRELNTLDPDRYQATDRSTKKRLVRAIEIARYARGHTVVTSDPCPVELRPQVFALDVPRKQLHQRIDRRLDVRLAEGMIEEVEGLLAAGVTRARLSQLGLEYREIAAYVAGDKTRDTMVDDLRLGIKRFAKRQTTWFRGFPRRGIPLQWIDPTEANAVHEMVGSLPATGQ